MKIGGKYNPEDVFLRHWYSLVSDTEIAKKKLAQQLKEFSKLCLERAYQLKDSLKLEEIDSPIFQDILMVIESRSKLIR